MFTHTYIYGILYCVLCVHTYVTYVSHSHMLHIHTYTYTFILRVYTTRGERESLSRESGPFVCKKKESHCHCSHTLHTALGAAHTSHYYARTQCTQSQSVVARYTVHATSDGDERRQQKKRDAKTTTSTRAQVPPRPGSTTGTGRQNKKNMSHPHRRNGNISPQPQHQSGIWAASHRRRK